MKKLLLFFRAPFNFIFQSKVINNKFFFKIIKKIYSFFFTRSGVKNVSKYIVEIDLKMRKILEKYSGYIGCGNCLFLARNQDSFGKNDIDYCVQSVSEDNLNELVNDIEKTGAKLSSKLFHKEKIIELKFNYKKTYFDVFILERINDDFVMSSTILMNDKFPIIEKGENQFILNKCCVVNQKWPLVKEFIEKEMYGHKFLIPKNYDEYLNYQYGMDWRTPIKNFDFLNNPKDNLPTLYNGEGKIVTFINEK